MATRMPVNTASIPALWTPHPGNLRVLSDATKLLVKWNASRSGLNKTQSAYAKRVIRTILMLISRKTNQSYFNN